VQAVAVYESTNQAKVKSRMQQAITNLETELSNTQYSTGEKASIAAVSHPYMKQQSVDMGTKAQTNLGANVTSRLPNRS
jgi:hypothetical protein